MFNDGFIETIPPDDEFYVDVLGCCFWYCLTFFMESLISNSELRQVTHYEHSFDVMRLLSLFTLAYV